MIRKKKKSKEEIEENRKEIEKQNEFFLEIWKERKHNCIGCYKWLGFEPKTYMFDHLLEKSKYPEFKYDRNNIVFVCLDCHACKTQGFPKENHKKEIELIKTKYNI